jgi:RNA polymerase sigma factor (sigma-70 family)
MIHAHVAIPGVFVLTPPVTASALTDLYRSHQMGLVRLAMVLTGDEASAEDVVQDVFVRMHTKAPRLRDEDKLLAYARAAVLNSCRQVLRRRKLAERRSELVDPPVWSAEASVLLSEERREVMRMLDRLPRRQREALVLRYNLELTDREIAEAMGIREVSVRSNISRALDAFAREMGVTR